MIDRTGVRSPSQDRAASPVVGKLLEAVIVVLYLSMLSAVLFGGVVPEYRAAAGAELGDRVLAEAALEVQSGVPEPGMSGDAELAVDLPETIRGEHYRIRAGDDALVLEHPHPAIGGEHPLAMFADEDRIAGSWNSTGRTVVVVESTGKERIVRLETRSARDGEELQGTPSESGGGGK